MKAGDAGVREPMERPAVERPLAVSALAVGLALVLLAGEPAAVPQTFSNGAVLRATLLALLSAAALFTAWSGPSLRPTLGRGRSALLAAPLLIALLGLPTGGWPEAVRHGLGWLILGLLPLALLWIWAGPRDAARTLRALVLAGALAALFVLFEALSGRPAVGPFGRSGIAGPVLGALLAPALLLPPLRLRLWRILPAVLLLGGCLATRSRTGVLAMSIGLVAAYAVRAHGAVLRRRLRMGLAIGAALLVVGLGLMIEDVLPFPGSRSTVEVRLGLHRASLAAIAERPLHGHGLGAFPATALEHRDLLEAQLEPKRRAFHAHNDYLHVGVEGGLGASLLLMLLLGGLTLSAARAATRATGEERNQAAAALGIIVTLAVAALADCILIDPAPLLLLAVAAAVALRPGSGPRQGARGLWQLLTPAAGLLLLAGCYGLALDSLADRALMRYRHVIAGNISVQEAALAARQHLVEGALRWRPDTPEALYRLAVYQASTKQYPTARRTYRKALAADPAMTEARLDLAQVYVLEGRPKDARSVLDEALRRDPTRYDIPRRIMELLLGPEPVPGDAPLSPDRLEATHWLHVVDWMNRARELAPERFENLVDEARFARRRAADKSGLSRAGAWLRKALQAAPGGPQGPPAEVLIESFRLAEAEHTLSGLFYSSILTGALKKNPRPARRLAAEAERFLDIGQERQEAALERAQGDPADLDMAAANRAFNAAAVRLTALLYADQLGPDETLKAARVDKEARRFRRALARYRSLLAWTLPPKEGEPEDPLQGPRALEVLARQGDLLLEAASVAHRVDRALALFYRLRGQLLIGVELLETRPLKKDRLRNARRKFEGVIESDPDQADAHYGLARTLTLLGDDEEAEAALLEALRQRPGLGPRAVSEPDLALLRRRPAVKARLGLP